MSEKRMRSYEVKCLLELLCALVKQKELPKWKRHPDWGSLYKLSDYHNVANIVYYGLLGMDYEELKPWKKKFEERYHQAVLSEEYYSGVLPLVVNTLEQYKIHCMVLQGYIMRHFYPQPDMRFTSSVRILIDKGREEALKKAMAYLDFEEQESPVEGELRYYKIPGVLLVFLTELSFINRKSQKYFSLSLKDYGKEPGHRYIHKLDTEEYYILTLACAAESYARGSIDIQFMLDIWFFYIKSFDKMDWAVIYKELSYLDLGDFPEYIIKLTANWFAGMLFAGDSLFEAMERYILTKGVQGRKESESLLPLVKEVADFYRKDLKKKRRQQILDWVFPGKDYMGTMFPAVSRFVWLLPVCWILRLIRMMSHYISIWASDKGKILKSKWETFYRPKSEKLHSRYLVFRDRLKKRQIYRKEKLSHWWAKRQQRLLKAKRSFKRRLPGISAFFNWAKILFEKNKRGRP